MHFLTNICSLEQQPLRVKNAQPKHRFDDPSRPSYFAQLETTKLLHAAAQSEFPDMIDITTASMGQSQFNRETVCTKFSLHPDDQFCVISTFRDETRQRLLAPEDRYRDGFSMYCDEADLSSIVDIAYRCDFGSRIPNWMHDAIFEAKRNRAAGVARRYSTSLQEAREFCDFGVELYQIADLRFNSRIDEGYTSQGGEFEMLQEALYGEPESHSSDYNWSLMVSAPVVERLVEKVVDDRYNPCGLNHCLHETIADNLPFWSRCRGVISHVLLDC